MFNFCRECSAHQLVMENHNDEIMACMCLRTYPNIPAILPELWKEVLSKYYNLGTIDFENTLFIHLMLWDKRYNWEWITYMLKTVFLCMFRLQNVILLLPAGCEHVAKFTYHLLGKYFYEIPMDRKFRGQNTQKLFVALRDNILPHFQIRRAV